jgi:hypothetical protein
VPAEVLPDFLVIGALKAATTTIATHLGSHPEVFVPARKELAFFTYEYNWLRGRAWYSSCFAGSEGALRRGEASPHYAWWPSHEGVPERASAVVPGARIVYVVRDPFERMASMYRQAWSHGGERRTFARAVLETADYLDTSCYHAQLARWLACFPADQVLVVTTEALRADPAATLATVFGFLDVDTRWVPPDPAMASNVTPPDAASVPAVLPEPVRALALERIRPDVEALAPYVASPFDGWGLLG